MKITLFKYVPAFLMLAASAFYVSAAEPTLKVGDAPPKLQNGKWVQGDAVKEFQKGKAYNVEFWATWCGPCRVSIPHLNEIAEKYKDKGLVVIGQDCWEEDEDLVVPFVKKMGDQMKYRVALDDKNGSAKGKMADTWITAAGQDGIPTAFLVDTNGVLAWIGRPMELKEKVIDEVLAGKFDVKKAAAEFAQRKQNEEKMNEVGAALGRAMQGKDWETAAAKVEELKKLMPEDERDNLDTVSFGILIGKKDYPAAYKLALQISDAHKSDSRIQDQLAWQIVADPSIEQRDLAVAETIATRANEAAKGQDASVLDTVARVQFMRGRKDEAIVTQEKAVKLAEEGQKADLQKSLDSYKKGELPKLD